MGGNALTCDSVRLGASDYRKVEADVVGELRRQFPQRRIESIMAYSDKADFGDLDVLVEGGLGFEPERLAQALHATEVVRNGDVTSIGISVAQGIFQVDLIRTPAESFDFSVRYFGLNDFGNLIGRVGHKFGTKFGHLGLLYPIRDPDNSSHVIAEVVITRNFGEALSLLGYDAERFEAMRDIGAFRSLEDMFRFVISSPYANRQIYLLDNRNHAARTRDAKRATYNAFLTWIEAQPASTVPAYPWADAGTAERKAQKESFLKMAWGLCPAFKAAFDQATKDGERRKLIKTRFNGRLAGEATGLCGKALGELMAHVRNSFSDEASFEAFFLEATLPEAKARFSMSAADIHRA